MHLTYNNVVEQILEHIKDSLGAFILKEYRKIYPHNYSQKLAYALQRVPTIAGFTDTDFGNETRLLAVVDVAGWLNVLFHNWEHTFQTRVRNLQKADVEKLRNTRIRWAHRNEAQYKEFTGEEVYEVALLAAKLLKAINQPEQAVKVHDIGSKAHIGFRPLNHYRVVDLPPNYVQRTELLQKVRGELLTGDTALALTSAIKVQKRSTALHGMGGIGKSVIARAICDEPDIQKAFSDGILWITLGQTPDIIAKLREIIKAIGGIITENAPTVEYLKTVLADRLKEQACLLVVDDVWERKHIEVFQVSSSKSRLLITTRDSEIAHEIGASVYPVPGMNTQESIALLEQWADGKIQTTSVETKEQIVNRLGYLPLAIKLAGSQLRDSSPDEWLKKIDVRRLKSRRPENVHDSLEQTFTLSLDALADDTRSLYVSLAIFKEDESIHEAAVQKLWQGLDDKDILETKELIHDLSTRALLQATENGKLVLHDLLRDFIIKELGKDIQQTHKILLDEYGKTCKGDDWHTALDDGYLYNHLAYHLNATGNLDEFERLFANQEWFKARLAQADYVYDSYLSDLNMAGELAKNQPGEQTLTLTFRWALIQTSLASLAENYSIEAVARAVEIGMWSPIRGLSIAQKISEIDRRVNLFILLLYTDKLNDKQKEDVVKQILSDLKPFKENSGQFTFQGSPRQAVLITPYLKNNALKLDLLKWAFAKVVKVGGAETGSFFWKVFWNQLPEELIHNSLQLIKVITSLASKLSITEASMVFINTSILDKYLKFHNINDEEVIDEILSSEHTTRFNKFLKSEYIEEDEFEDETSFFGLGHLYSYEEYYWSYFKRFGKKQARILFGFAPYFTETQKKYIIENLEALLPEDDIIKAESLMALAPYLKDDLLELARLKIQKMPEEWQEKFEKARTAPVPLEVEEFYRTHLFPDDIEKAIDNELTDYYPDSVNFKNLIPHISEQQLLRILKIASHIMHDELARALALTKLAICVTNQKQKDNLLQRALNVIQMLPPGADGTLPDEPRGDYYDDEALETPQGYALAYIEPYLTGNLITQAFEIAFLLDNYLYIDDIDKGEFFLKLAQRLPEDEKQMEKVINLIKQSNDENLFIEILVAIFPRLPSSLIKQLAGFLEKDLFSEFYYGITEDLSEQQREELNEWHQQVRPILEPLPKEERRVVFFEFLSGLVRTSTQKEAAPVVTDVTISETTDADISDSIKKAIEAIWNARHSRRDRILMLCHQLDLFKSCQLSQGTTNAIADSIIEICWQWEWV